MPNLSPVEGLRALFTFGVLLASGVAAGRVARRVSQPAVVGELLVGIFLGPTVVGRLWPGLEALVVPAPGFAASALAVASKVGLVAFVFGAGAEIGAPAIAGGAKRILAIATSGFVLPLTMGACLSAILGGSPSPRPADWFLGIALAVSALPVIVRTLTDLELLATPFGSVVVGSVVVTDVIAWAALAGVVLSTGRATEGGIGHLVSDLVLAVFLVGLALPRRMREALTGEGAPRALTLLRTLGATLYFASAGLRLDLFTSLDVGFTAAVFAVAIAAKTLGSFTGARLTGVRYREAAAIGTAMNARGAMEIVFAGTGLDLGLADMRTYATLVVLAIVTSVMTAPIVRLVKPDPSLTAR